MAVEVVEDGHPRGGLEVHVAGPFLLDIVRPDAREAQEVVDVAGDRPPRPEPDPQSPAMKPTKKA
jgi:hypothetical protein